MSLEIQGNGIFEMGWKKTTVTNILDRGRQGQKEKGEGREEKGRKNKRGEEKGQKEEGNGGNKSAYEVRLK